HAAHPAVGVAGHDRVAHPQRAALHQHGGHRTATTVQVRLDRHTLGLHVRVGPQVQGGVGGEQHRLEQLVDVGALLGGDVDEHGVAAVLLGHQAVLGELTADLGRVGALLVDLVDRHHDRHVGGLRVVDRLHRLRHHTVVGRDHQDRDVGGLRTTGTHRGERLVTRGVDEGDRPFLTLVLHGELVGADVLGDATGLTLADGRLPDGVEQPGLTVVDVTHHGHHRRAAHQVRIVALVHAVAEVEGFEQFAVLVLGADDLNLVVHLAAEQFEDVVADGLGGGHHLTEVEQRLHQRRRVGVDLLGEIGQRRTAGQPDGLTVALGQPHAADDRRLHRVVLLPLLPFRLAATLRRAPGTAERTRRAAALSGATAAGTTAEPAGGRRTATAVTTTAATRAATATGSTPATGARTGPGTRDLARPRNTRPRRHVARRHAGTRR